MNLLAAFWGFCCFSSIQNAALSDFSSLCFFDLELDRGDRTSASSNIHTLHVVLYFFFCLCCRCYYHEFNTL